MLKKKCTRVSSKYMHRIHDVCASYSFYLNNLTEKI